MSSRTSTPREPWRQYRLFEFDVDDDWVRTHNENRAEIRRLQASAAFLGLVFLAVGIGVAAYNDFRPGGIMALIAFGVVGAAILSMIAVIPKKMGSMQWTYSSSELVPAMVAEVKPRGLVLMALVDQAVDRSAGESRPALAVRSVEKLPGVVTPRTGLRVPAVAVVGNRSTRRGENTYDFVSPLPVAWGTGDKKVWKAAEERIPGAEWERLRQSLDRRAEVERTRTNVLPLER